MKSKGGGLFGIFKKKTTPAPAAPTSPPLVETRTETVNASSSSNSTDSGLEHVEMDVVQPPPRKGSIAKTSVIHYSPPGTVRTSPKSTAPSSLVSADNSLEDNENAVVITRKSNIVLDDEESVISTPISQYDETPIVHKSRKKRTAPPPPPPVQTTVPLGSPVVPSSSSIHYRQTSEVSRTSSESTPPTLPPHQNKKNEESADYEEMLKKLQNKFDEWHQVRIEDGGSVREERIKAEVLKEHLKLKVLLEKEISPTKSSATPPPTVTNNNNYVKLAPKSVPGGTVYQKTAQQIRPSKTDENKNDIVYSSKNSAAVDRLRKEVEEQRQREREVKQYRNPKTMSPGPGPKSPDPSPNPGPKSPSSPGPRMVEYKPMKSRDSEGDVPPPIPKTPPPKLSEYRKESPRMPTVPQNGYVRLQVGKKTVAPTVPQGEAPVAPMTKKIYSPVPYTGPEYASSPKLLRKNQNQNPQVVPGSQVQVPVKEKEIVYQKPQQHPQMTSPKPTSESPIYQKKTRVTVNATSSESYQKIQKAPVMDESYLKIQKIPTSPPPIRTTIQRGVSQDVTSSESYRKIQKTPEPIRTSVHQRGISLDVTSSESKTPKSPPPVRTTVPPKMMQRAVSQDAKPNNFIYQKSSTSPRPVRSTVFPPKGSLSPPVAPPAPPTLSATSPVYQKITVIPVSPKPVGIPTATSSKPKGPPKETKGDGFDISDVLRGPRLKKVGMPVEKSGISLGKVLDSSGTPSRPSTVPPPPPPPMPIAAGPNVQNSWKPTIKTDIRDTLMSEIREAGRLRAARVSQNA